MIYESSDRYTYRYLAVLNDPMLYPDKLRINGNFLEKGCEENGYIVLPILNIHVSALETLKRPKDAPKYNDPFDRIMVAQAATGISDLVVDYQNRSS